MRRIPQKLIPCLIGLALGALYLTTMAPGLTWAFDGADGGDLVTAAATGGVPHPTGYPTYLLAASAFLKIPIGSLAYRTNLLSVICTVFAALMVYKIVQTFDQSIFSASIASLAFGTFPLVWSQAIITEVNALNALFTALLLYFFMAGDQRWQEKLLDGFIGGLALGNHLSIVLILPLMLLGRPQNRDIQGNIQRKIPADLQLILVRLAGLILGLAVYLVIPLRARAQAPVNWGEAVNWTNLLWLVSGKMYWGRLEHFTGSYLLAGFQSWSGFMLRQLGVIGIALCFVTLAILFRRSRLYLASGWMAAAYSVFAILYFSPDSYVYLIPALISCSIWIGLGAGWLYRKAAQKLPRLGLAVAFGLGAALSLRACLAIPTMSLAADRTPELRAGAVLNFAPPHAMIFTQGDEATFSLWYLHYAYHQRPDVAVISDDLLVQDWYHEVLRKTYSGLIVADIAQERLLVHDNPDRPVCHWGPDLQTPVSCSP